MAAFHTITQQPLEQLETELVSLFQRVTATEYEFLVLLREFDLRQGWREYCFNNCAEWLNFKCGMDAATGREKLRVAHALWVLPRLSAAYQRGELSYSKARSLTRLATPETEEALLAYGLGATAEQVQRHCQELRNADRQASTADVNRIHRRRFLSRTRQADGSMTISIELTQEAGELVMKALEMACATMRADSQHAYVQQADAQPSEAGTNSLAARQADALVAVAQAYLAGGRDSSNSEKSGSGKKSSGKPGSSADHYNVMVHVDEAALREVPGQAHKSALPLESIRRLCCDGSLLPVTEDEKGNPLHVGRKHRVVQPALRRALLARDRCCRFPGCTNEHWVDAHHVKHWIDGGETSLANTLLLCSAHHRLLHEGGFSIAKNLEGDWFFRNARGRVIANAPISSAGYALTKIVTNPSADALPQSYSDVRDRPALYTYSA